MNYLNFQKDLNKTLFDIDIQMQYQIGKYLIKKDLDENYITEDKTFKSFDGSYKFISGIIESKKVLNSNQQEINVSDKTIAFLIKENHKVKVTNTLIENVKNTIRNKTFSLDPIIEQLREHDIFDEKIDFLLSDNSHVFIDKNTLKEMINLFGKHQDIIEYLNSTSDNFMKTVKQVIGKTNNGC